LEKNNITHDFNCILFDKTKSIHQDKLLDLRCKILQIKIGQAEGEEVKRFLLAGLGSTEVHSFSQLGKGNGRYSMMSTWET